MDIVIGVYSDGLATSEMVMFCLVFDYVSMNDILSLDHIQMDSQLQRWSHSV